MKTESLFLTSSDKLLHSLKEEGKKNDKFESLLSEFSVHYANCTLIEVDSRGN